MLGRCRCPEQALDTAVDTIPYATYGVQANRGTVCVGNSAPRFPGDSASRRGGALKAGPATPGSTSLLILVGSNGCRPRTWQHALQRVQCNRHGLRVAHYPAGCSHWNPIEHRLFSFLGGN